jgi:ABC-type polysaccharide/polyol phosphate export permease
LLLLGIVYFLSALAVSFVDISYFVTLFLLLLMFISPIGYQPEKIDSSLLPMVYFNRSRT